MLHHVVLMKIAEPADADEAVARLRALPEQIDDIGDYEVGRDISRGPTSYDLGLYSTFVDAAALERYRVHPAHQEVVAFIGGVSTGRVVVDWESP